MTRYSKLRWARLGTMSVSLLALLAILVLPRLAIVFISLLFLSLIAGLVINVLLRQELLRRLDQVRAENGGVLPAPAPGVRRTRMIGLAVGFGIGLAVIAVSAILVPELRIPAVITAAVLAVVVPLALRRASRQFDVVRPATAAPTNTKDEPPAP